jgi:RNA polymerase sigma-54 factor
MLRQRLQQKLQQKLSPQQVLVMRLLQEPVLSLEQRIKQEIEENPALEETDNTEADEEDLIEGPTLDTIEGDEDELRDEVEITPEDMNEFTFEDYLDEEEIPEYRLLQQHSKGDEERHEMPVVSKIGFQDYLLAQLGLHRLTDKQFIIAATIIGNIDESGYLRREDSPLIDDLAFNQNIEVSPAEVNEMLSLVQKFDPPGIGARHLQECLQIQLRRVPERTDATELALKIIDRYFNDFSRKRFDRIMDRAKVSEEELKNAIAEIQKLNPKPGSSISEISRDNQYIIPDFIITNIDSELELTLNSRNIPELILNRQYLDMLSDYSRKKTGITSSDKSAITFIKQKLDSAKGFIEAIRQRQDTLFKTMLAIMNYQYEYFLTGEETKLKPMILKDIATLVHLDISTISRVANSKYVQTPFGTFLLKSFFSESMQNARGEEISTREIKKAMKDIIEQEDPSNPYNDDQLVDLLKQKGYNVARRTLSKYRKRMNIPVARLRTTL